MQPTLGHLIHVSDLRLFISKVRQPRKLADHERGFKSLSSGDRLPDAVIPKAHGESPRLPRTDAPRRQTWVGLPSLACSANVEQRISTLMNER